MDLDFLDGMDLGGEPEDYCTSATCRDRATCGLFRPGGDPTTVSDKIHAARCGLCPYFTPLPGRYPDELCHPLVCWPDEEEDRQRWALTWFLSWRETIPFLLLDGDEARFTKPVPYPDLWSALGGRMRDWAWAEQGGLDLSAMQDLLLQRTTIRAQRPTKENSHVGKPQQSDAHRERREGPRDENPGRRANPRHFFDGDHGNLEVGQR